MADESAEYEEPWLGARGLTLCQRVEYIPDWPDAPYTLHGVLSVLQCPFGLPGVWRQPVWLYAEFFGSAGEHQLWVDLVRQEADEDGMTEAAAEETNWGPFVFRLATGLFVKGWALCVPRLPLTAEGLHQFRLSLAGSAEPIATIQFLVEEPS